MAGMPSKRSHGRENMDAEQLEVALYATRTLYPDDTVP
jgi:hypothetical protein